MRNKGGPPRTSGRLAVLMWIVLAVATVPAAVAADSWRVRDGIDLNARSGPGTEHQVVETLRSGAVVEELERNGNWSRVRTPAGNVAFVHNGYLEEFYLENETSNEQEWTAVLQPEHSIQIDSVAVSADGRIVATGSSDGTARLWDVASGRQLRVLEGHSSVVSSVSFSPDGLTIATGSWDNTTRLWDVGSGRELLTLKGHSDFVYSVAVSPDGRTIATGSGDRTVRLWDAATGRELRVLKRHSLPVVSIAFSPDGRIVATGSSDGSVRLWDVVSGREMHILKGHLSEVYGVAFSPDGGTVVTGSYDGVARLWDAASGQLLLALERISAGILSIAFSPDGRTIATGSTDGTVRVWDATSGNRLRMLETQSFDVNSVAFGTDGRTLLATSSAGAVQIWDMETGQERGMIALFDDGSNIVVTRDGFFDAAGGGSKYVDMFRGSESFSIDQFHEVLNRPDLVREALAGDPEGRVAAAAAALDLDEAGEPDKSMHILALTSLDGNRVEKNTAKLSLGIENYGDDKGYIELRSNDVLLEWAVDAIDWNGGDAEDDKILWLQRRIDLFPGENEISVTAYDDDGNVLSSKRLSIVRVHVREPHVWQVIPQIGDVSSDFWDDIRFSPDGRTLATVSTSRGSIWLWNAANGRTLRSLTGRSVGVGRFVFSPNSRTIAAESFDLKAEIWDVETGQMLRVLDHGNYEADGTVTFSPDGRVITTSDLTGNVRLWDATTGRILHQLEAGRRLLIIEHSPDGRFVATGARDNIRLWDATTGRLLHELDGMVDYSSSIRFDPSGLTIATGSAHEATVRLWDTSTGRELNAPDVLRGRIGKDEITRLAFSPDGSIVATGLIDGAVLLQEMATGLEVSLLHGHADPVTNIVFSGDGRIIATGSRADGSVRLWNSATGRQLKVLEGHVDGTTDIAFSPDGRIVATVSGDATGRIWEVETGRELRVLNSLADAFSEVALSPDGRIAAQGNYGGQIRLWDVENGVHLAVLDAHEDYVTNIEFSPDGRLLMSSTFEGTKRAWDITKDYEPSPEENLPDFTDTETSPDGRYSVMVGTEGLLHLFDRNVSQRHELFGHTAQITAAEFSSDSRALVTGSWDRTARLWETATGRELQVLKGHAESVNGVAFGADGQMILTGSSDGTARLWDAASGRELAQFVSFTDGSWIVLTPEGFFNASEGGARHLNLVRGLEVLSVDQVYDALFRPDLVREALAGDPDGKVAAAAARLDLGKVLASGLPPRLGGLHSLDGDMVEGDAVELSVEVEDRGGGVGRVEWRVNGVVQGADSRGLGGLAVEDEGPISLREHLFLVPGENVVSVIAYNEAGLIASEPVEIILESRQGAVSRPKLHVLAVGVDDYFDSRLELNYAVSDARALGTALKKAGRDLYDAVEVTYLLDDAVSVEGLGRAFEDLGREVRPQDVFVFFLAGHGRTLDGRYYFLPRDFRYRDSDDLKETAISQQQLQSWLSRVSAQKSVLLFDTCESGSLTQEAVTRGLEDKAAIERLSRAVGRTVLTASTDTAPALEGYRQHGLFTYVFLEAFASGDADGDNQVEIDEMIGYVDERLPELSEAAFGYRQVPQHSSRGSFFPLGRPVAILSETEDLIPRTPTHVVTSGADVIETPGDLQSVIETFVPGVTVRVVEHADAWVRIAVNGVSIGWTEKSRLAVLQ